jgi:predicted CXXCH cytochrome family protein
MKTALPAFGISKPLLRRLALAAWCLASAGLYPGGVAAKMSVLNSPHNLSASAQNLPAETAGKHRIYFSEENRVCIFCHAPHNTIADTTGVTVFPLWSRDVPPDAGYTPYNSTTLKATPKPDKPTGASRLCLSCHDGTIALARFVGGRVSDNRTMPSDRIPTRNPNLTTDLSDDHPISFQYSDSLALLQGELAMPSSLPTQIKLGSDGSLECTACHDAHNNEFGNFLVMDNRQSGSPLCVACHKNNGWNNAVHNPANTSTLTSACLNCHYNHSAPGPERLLHSKTPEENCLGGGCHDSSGPAYADLNTLYAQTLYKHQAATASAVHDENEQLPARQYHVECVDCHNPHQANRVDASAPAPSPPATLSAAPAINGSLAGVKKDSAGTIATKEYEICFKCHSGGNATSFTGISKPNRMISEPDEQMRFASTNNPSYHPVMNMLAGGNSLINSQLIGSMVTIYCSDCHNNSQGRKAGKTGPNGPHGSEYEHILIDAYDMPAAADTSSTRRYDLCYRCHSQSYIMGTSSGFYDKASSTNEHTAHVTTRNIPCFACHDPHGIPWYSGTKANNAHLINFSKDYTFPVPGTSSSPLYTVATSGGTCYVKCHTASPNGDYTETYARTSSSTTVLNNLKRRLRSVK